MQSLRRARFLARLVLAWFALSLGVAIASPLVKPSGIEVICSGTGAMKLLVKGDADGGKPASSHTLDCPLCASIAAPPPAVRTDLVFVPALGHAVQPIPAARIAALTAAPLPARGPPSLPEL
jgi:hypothetical protein